LNKLRLKTCFLCIKLEGIFKIFASKNDLNLILHIANEQWNEKSNFINTKKPGIAGLYIY